MSEGKTGEPSEGADVGQQRSAIEGQPEEQQQAQEAPATGLPGSGGGTESRYEATHGKKCTILKYWKDEKSSQDTEVKVHVVDFQSF